MGSHAQFHQSNPSRKGKSSHHQPQTHSANQQSQPSFSSVQAGRDTQQREFLWRERVKLEMQVQAVLAHVLSLQQEWQRLMRRKAAM